MVTTLTPNRAWARLASDEQIERMAAVLEINRMQAIVVETGTRLGTGSPACCPQVRR
jgi:hypothetical protein